MVLQAEETGGTVGKALKVLDEIASHGHPVRFSEVLATSPHPKATLYRLLKTLTSQGMLSYDQDRQVYSLGVRLVRLAHAAWRQSSLAPIAKPFLFELSEKFAETVHLAQLDNGQVLYVDKINAKSPVEMYSQAGKVGPAYCTGVGKAMLAFLPETALGHALAQQAFHAYSPATLTSAGQLRQELEQIRKNGFAFDREEHEPGIICIAVPILSPNGRMIGGLSVTSPTNRYTVKELSALKPALVDTARQIGIEAQSWLFPEQNQPPQPPRTTEPRTTESCRK